MANWNSADLAITLGYADRGTINRRIHRSILITELLGISSVQHFIKSDRHYELTPFAVFLVLMQCNPQKEEVKTFRNTYFGGTETIKEWKAISAGIERLLLREELIIAQKRLNRLLKKARISDYGQFSELGYRGLYQRSRKEVYSLRGIPKDDEVLDHLGKLELGLHLNRLLLTSAAIQLRNVNGQASLQKIHFEVSEGVRELCRKQIGVAPENIPTSESLPEFKARLKRLRHLIKNNNNELQRA